MIRNKPSKYRKVVEPSAEINGFSKLDTFRLDLYCLESSWGKIGLTVNLSFRHMLYYIDSYLYIVIPDVENRFPICVDGNYKRMPVIGSYTLNFSIFSDWIYSNSFKSSSDIPYKVHEFFEFARCQIDTERLKFSVMRRNSPTFFERDIRTQLITSSEVRAVFDEWRSRVVES